MKTVLLIDADLIVYRAAAGNEEVFDWGDDVVVTHADLEAAKNSIRDSVDNLVTKLDADDVIMCLSDDHKNWRKSVLPTYKSNRKETVRPQLLYELKEWVFKTYRSRRLPTLEADDLLGIMSTEPHEGELRIMVTQDKDMKTIPGHLYRLYDPAPEVMVITEEDAKRYHLYQTIIGDTTDGYTGCPGAGPAAANKLLDGNIGWERYDHVLRSGSRKGEVEVRWRPKTFDTPWQAIVSLYEKHGLAEADALVQARVARILHASEFDGRNSILWEPGE